MNHNLLAWLEYTSQADPDKPITLEEFTAAMQSGDKDRRRKAIEQMLAAGGYDNLE